MTRNKSLTKLEQRLTNAKSGNQSRFDNITTSLDEICAMTQELTQSFASSSPHEDCHREEQHPPHTSENPYSTHISKIDFLDLMAKGCKNGCINVSNYSLLTIIFQNLRSDLLLFTLMVALFNDISVIYALVLKMAPLGHNTSLTLTFVLAIHTTTNYQRS